MRHRLPSTAVMTAEYFTSLISSAEWFRTTIALWDIHQVLQKEFGGDHTGSWSFLPSWLPPAVSRSEISKSEEQLTDYLRSEILNYESKFEAWRSRIVRYAKVDPVHGGDWVLPTISGSGICP